MSEPKNHHLVPVCYLKNFGRAKYDKKKPAYYIDVFNKHSADKQIFTANVKSVCVEKEYYTFSKLAEDQKRFLEKYFSKMVECYYTPLYKKLASSDPLHLTNVERQHIIEFVIHQFFRTSKLTNNFNQFWSNLLSRGYEMTRSDNVLKQVDFDGRIIDFEKESLEKVIKDDLQSNREYINASNYSRIKELIEKRKGDHIAIEKVHPDHFLITSDNPVTFDGHYLNPNTIIHMPINSCLLLTIIPEAKLEVGTPLYRRTNLIKSYSEILVTYNNLYQFEKCERIILGDRKHLANVIETKKNFDIKAFMKKAQAVSDALETIVESIVSQSKIDK
jgi:hypothetical protein